MIQIEIDGIPVNWKSHVGYGRKSFNPKYKERAFYQWQIRAQYNRELPIAGPVVCYYTFHMPIPASTSKVRKLQMLNGIMHPIKRPDVDNLNKFLSDCLKGIVFEDDSLIVELNSKKVYGERPKTIIRIEEMNGQR